MPLSFPSNPSVNQTSTQNGRQYRWSGAAWEFVPATGGGTSWVTAPASATASGTAGQVAYDASGYLYLCVATDTWVRYAGSTWYTMPTISGLQLHLDASDASTLYDATSGGSLVAADGAVARWEDKSGNGRHATQATSGYRPTRKLSQANGQAALLFPVSSGTADNTGTCMDVSMTLSQPFTMVAVVRAKRTDTYLCDGTSDTNRIAIGTDLNGTSPGQWGMYNSGVVEGGGNAANVWRMLVCRWDGASSSIRINGTDQGSGNVGSGGISGLRIGSRVNNAFSGADVGELLIYSSVLSSGDRSALEAYLTAKWGL